jgi:hypothetical protein
MGAHKKQPGIRDVIARDRSRARVFAAMVLLPIVVAFSGALYTLWFVAQIWREATGQEHLYDSVVTFLFATFAAVTTIGLAVLAARWSFSFVRNLLVPQRIQAIWLRRFQAEGGGAFRTSRVIDGLARDGISTLTLQDRDVRLSLEQRRHRLAPMFWSLTAALLGAFSIYFASKVMWFTTAAQSLAAIYFLLEAWGLVVLILLMAIGIAAAAGPIATFFSRNRDDYAKMPRLMARIAAGRRRRGAVVLRICDANWRAAVVGGLAVVDVVIVDISQVTEHIAWEIREAVSTRGRGALVFISRESAGGPPPQAVRTLENAGAFLPAEIVYYPKSRRDRNKAREFASGICEAIYSAMDRVSRTPQ